MMNITGYEFREGMIFQAGAKADPAVVGSALEDLRKQFRGELRAEDVVEAARSKNSPLHAFFEWDDSAAAHHHRLAQARSLIRCVVAIYKNPQASAEPIRIHAFTHIRDGEASHYRDTAAAMNTRSTREAILKRAWDELKQWQRRYKELKEFSELFSAMEDAEKKLPRKITRVN